MSLSDLEDRRHDLALAMSVRIASEKSATEFAIVRRKSLPQGKNIKQIAVELFQSLQIGKKNGKGVLIVFVESTREVKIEVSYELEGLLPDVLCRRLEDAAQTYFLSDQSQDYFSELLITLSNAIADKETQETNWSFGVDSFYRSGGAGLRSVIASRDGKKLLDMIGSNPTMSKNLAANNPEQVLEEYLKSLELGIGDPRLPILTDGSRIFRVVVPRTKGQLLLIGSDYRKAGLHKVFVKGNMALAAFRQGTSTLPVWMERDGAGYWRVDEVKSWTFFHRFEDSRNYFLLSNDNPFRTDLMADGEGGAQCTIYKDRFSTLSTPSNTGDRALFDWGWFSKASEEYRELLKKNPGDDSLRWKLIHVSWLLSEPESALEQLEILYQKHNTRDRELREWRYFYQAEYGKVRAALADNGFDAAIIRVEGFLQSAWKSVVDLFLPALKDPCLQGWNRSL